MRVKEKLALLLAAIALSGCRIGPAPVPSSDWRAAVTPDSALAFQVPRGYRQRNAYGCWNRVDGRWPSPADFCLRLVPAEEAQAYSRVWEVMCQGPKSTAGDASCFEGLRVDTASIDGRAAVVTRALRSGTISHFRRMPAVLVLIPLDSAGVAVLEGEHRERGTGAELVTIASTVRLLGRPADDSLVRWPSAP